MTILAVDVGTTGMKMGIFRNEGGSLQMVRQFARTYEINVYNNGLFGDIEPEKWQQAFLAGCREFGELAAGVEAIALSGTTPGLTAMDEDGRALLPAILMLDQRSQRQARRIIDTVGLPALLSRTGNMPVAGGCSLAGILWIQEHLPEVFRRTRIFGHSNTFMAAWLTGNFAIDPSSASLTALYNTVANDLTWNSDIAGAFGLPLDRLPSLIRASDSAGRMREPLARELGFNRRPAVVIGGNDAVLAAYSAGIEDPGDVINVNGTCEISLVCLPRCIPSTSYNVRAHVVPERWLTLYVMNAGGKALEWFHRTFCREMEADDFYRRFIPEALGPWIERDTTVTYVPFLMGSRYSHEKLTAAFTGLTQETTREELLAALIKGLCLYQAEHLREIGAAVALKPQTFVTGGAVGNAILAAKARWMRAGQYIHREESSLRGAAMLGAVHLAGGGAGA
jgi:sugar (pentulose or hexulose) kinase